MSADTKMKTAGLVAAGASTTLNRRNTLVNDHSYGYDNVNDNNFHPKPSADDIVNGTPSMFHHDISYGCGWEARAGGHYGNGNGNGND